MNRQCFVGLIFLGITNAAFGYNFTFYNYTNNSVNVRIKLAASVVGRHIDIAPRGGYIFSLQGVYSNWCLGKIFINGQLKRQGRVCRDASFYIEEQGTPADPANIIVRRE